MKNIIFKHMLRYLLTNNTHKRVLLVFTQSNQTRLSDNIQNVYYMIYIFSIQTRRMTIMVSGYY